MRLECFKVIEFKGSHQILNFKYISFRVCYILLFLKLEVL